MNVLRISTEWFYHRQNSIPETTAHTAYTHSNGMCKLLNNVEQTINIIIRDKNNNSNYKLHENKIILMKSFWYENMYEKLIKIKQNTDLR